MPVTKKVVLIDDHPIFRSGLKSVVEESGKYTVVGEANTAKLGMKVAEEKKPDILIIDITLPDMDGIRLTRIIRETNRKIAIMMVSAHAKVDFVIKSIQAGAGGYVTKGSGADCILKCLDQVANGRKYIDPTLTDVLCEWFLYMDPLSSIPAIAENGYASLSKREQEIFRLIAEKLSLKEISAKLCVSYKTVATHRSNIMRKLGLKSNDELIHYAIDIGLVDMT